MPTNTYPSQPPQPNLGNYLGTGAKIGGDVIKGMSAANAPAWNAAGNFVGQSSVNGAGSVLGSVLGKAIPLAGAATGIIGLLHNQGTGRNLMNGIGSGASIGSMFMPGVGTAIGAGIGALTGWLRGLGGPSQQELQGRGVNTNYVSAIDRLANPNQLREARGAVGHGWDNVNDPLSIIVMRDALTKAGMDPTMADKQAQAWKGGLYKGEQGGQQSMAQAFSPIQQFFQTGRVPTYPSTRPTYPSTQPTPSGY